MKYKTTISILVASLLVLGLTAHGEAQAASGLRKGFHGGRLFDALQLSETQKTEIRNLFVANRENLRPLVQQFRELRQSLRAAAESQPFDESQVRYQAQELAKLQAELIVARATLMNQVSTLLTPEQRAQWNNLREQRKQRLQQRWERRRQSLQVQPG